MNKGNALQKESQYLGSVMQVLIVDDSRTSLMVIDQIVSALPSVGTQGFSDPARALAAMAHLRGDLVVVDYTMPDIDGIEFIRRARTIAGYEHVPFVMITTNSQMKVRNEALEAGATDFLTKPFDTVEMRTRVRNLLAMSDAQRKLRDHAVWLGHEVSRAVSVIAAREEEIVTRLARAAEHRDSDTGDHIGRVAAYTRAIAEDLGLEPETCKALTLASTMHDVGKIAISDTILLKPGPLTPDERRIMECHAERGFRILDGSGSDLVRIAAEIALTHHERWDGRGYPRGLGGRDIPLPGRIVAVADVFDALVSHRPYKQAWPLARARAYLEENAGRQFDPDCVAAFLRRWDDIVVLAQEHGVEAAA